MGRSPQALRTPARYFVSLARSPRSYAELLWHCSPAVLALSSPGVPNGGNGGGIVSCRGLCSVMALLAVGLLLAFSSAAHSPAGMAVWWNAMAGAAVAASISADTRAAAPTLFALPKVLLSLQSLLQLTVITHPLPERFESRRPAVRTELRGNRRTGRVE